MKLKDLHYMDIKKLELIGSDIDYVCEDTEINFINSLKTELVSSYVKNGVGGSTFYDYNDYEFGKRQIDEYKYAMSIKHQKSIERIKRYKENYIKARSDLLNKALMQYRLSLKTITRLLDTSVIFVVNICSSRIEKEKVIFAQNVDSNSYVGGARYNRTLFGGNPKHIKCIFYPRVSRYIVTIEYHENNGVVTIKGPEWFNSPFENVKIYIPPGILN